MSNQTEQPPARMFTVMQVANMLNVSRSQIYTLFASGELGSVHVGGCRRITENQLNTYLGKLEEQHVTSL